MKSLIVNCSSDAIPLGRHRLKRDIACHTFETQNSEEEKRIHDDRMLFAFPAVRSVFGNILTAWFAYQTQLDDALSLYFSTVENRHLYSHHVFLFLAQALEVYHRCQPQIFAQTREVNANFKTRMRRVRAALSTADTRWFNDSFASANSPTLNTRLLEIFHEKREYLGDFIKDEKRFAAIIRRTRNHFTHWGGTKKKGTPVVADIDLVTLNYQLQVILRVCFLSDIGVPDSIVKGIVSEPNWTVVDLNEEDDEPPPPPRLALPAPKAPKNRKRSS